MKKALSVLLMVTMLVCLSAAAFAAPSPEQDTTPTDYGWPLNGGAKPAAKAPAVKAVEVVAEDDIVFDADVDAAVSDDTDKAAVSALTPKNLTAAFSGNKALMKAADGKTAVCTNPQGILSVEGKYPSFIKYTVDHHIDTVLLYMDGVWSVPADLEIVDNEDGSCTVSFTLEGPALYSDVSFK